MFQEESKNIQEIDPKLVMEREVQIRGSKNRSQKVSGHKLFHRRLTVAFPVNRIKWKMIKKK